MEVIKYKDKEGNEQKAVEVNSILSDMADMESFYGLTNDKVAEHWYMMKRQFISVVTEQEQPEPSQMQDDRDRPRPTK